MASNMTSNSVNNAQASQSPQHSRRGRGGSAQGRYNDTGPGGNPGSERGRGRGGRRGGFRGRGGRGGAHRTQTEGDDAGLPAPAVPPPPNQLRQGFSGARLTGGANVQEGEGLSKGKAVAGLDGADETEDDGEVCFICASPVVHSAVSPCNHRTCHICALRLRALYKTKACAHCRTVSDFVIFTDDPAKRYEDYTEDDYATTDPNLGIKYEKTEIFEDTVLLLRYNCPDPSCDVACLGWPDLHAHVKSVHHKVMCDLCTRNKKSFTHEHELFTIAELKKHEKFGDDHPGSEDQTGFRGHPECGFCRQRFYGDDELYAHCRDRHERCHICDKRNGGKTQYFVDYNSLEAHFRKEHFLCPDQECLDKKFVVFESQVDLQAHQLQEHPNGLSKDARRDARRVDMSNFDYRTGYQPERGGRRDRGRGRGRDPNTEPLPVSSAQPMRRDELAFQRQMAIQSAQSVTPRTFGGQLSSTETYAARPTTTATPATVTASRPVQDSLPSLSSLRISDNGTSPRPATPPQGTETPQEQARRLRHNAVTERAVNLLGNDQRKIIKFRDTVSAYKNGSTSAPELIDTFLALFDASSAELGKLIKELADIFEIAGKRDGLLKAWNDFKAINEDYPSLPVTSGSPAGTSTSSIARTSGSRVLKLKSSTAQSSRAAPGWGSAGSRNIPGASPLPPLPSANRAGAGRVGPTPWAGSSSSSSKPPPATSSRVPQPRNKGLAAGADAFPALPTAAKPQMPVLGYGYGTSVIRKEKGPATNAWNTASSSSAPSSNSVAAEPDTDEGEAAALGGGRKKGRSGRKQTLFHFG